jgi:AraC-like DNA-binding protein
MRIQAYLPNTSWDMLAGILPAHTSVERITSAQGLVAGVEHGDVYAIVVDVAEIREDLFDRVLAALYRNPGSVVVLSALSSIVALRIIQLASVGPVEVCVVGEGDAQLLRAIIRSLAQPTVPAYLIHLLAGRFAGLPRDLRTATTGLFSNRGVPRSAGVFSALGGASLATVDRQLKSAGLRPAKRLIDVGLVARTWRHLEAGRLSLGEVARRVGYSGSRTLDSHFARLVGLPPRAAAKALSAAEIAGRLAGVAAR